MVQNLLSLPETPQNAPSLIVLYPDLREEIHPLSTAIANMQDVAMNPKHAELSDLEAQQILKKQKDQVVGIRNRIFATLNQHRARATKDSHMMHVLELYLDLVTTQVLWIPVAKKRFELTKLQFRIQITDPTPVSRFSNLHLQCKKLTGKANADLTSLAQLYFKDLTELRNIAQKGSARLQKKSSQYQWETKYTPEQLKAWDQSESTAHNLVRALREEGDNLCREIQKIYRDACQIYCSEKARKLFETFSGYKLDDYTLG